MIRVQQYGNAGFLPAEAEVRTFQIVPVTQVITFDALPDRAIGNNEFEVNAEGGSSGFPITFASQTPTVCATGGTNGADVTLRAVGRCTIRASQQGDNNFTKADDVDQSFSVTSTSNEDLNNDWWRWRGGAGCTLGGNADFDWSLVLMLAFIVGLKLRRRYTYD